jgi:hypothetical protein
MGRWTAFTHFGHYRFDTTRLVQLWDRLHGGDAEPLPKDDAVLHAWALCHAGDFEKATETGLAAGGDGITVANKAMALYATYLEPSDKARQALLQEVARRAAAQAQLQPNNPNAWYWQAYALRTYSQGISVAKALALGLGPQVKAALERTLALQPRHADAHVGLGAFHAEVIDKVGVLIGGMTHGASRERGMHLFREGLRLRPDCASVLSDAAKGMLMLEGKASSEEADRLYERAAAVEPLDAIEHLSVERARTELQD